MLFALHDPCQAAPPTGAASAASTLPAAAPPSDRILAFPATRRVQPSSASPGFAFRRSLAGRAQALPQRQRAAVHDTPTETAKCFTVPDRIALMAWTSRGSGGYARVVLEDGVPGDAPDRSGYVLLYRRRDDWATIGLTRCAAGILVWRCANGASCGVHRTMADALAALPSAEGRS